MHSSLSANSGFWMRGLQQNNRQPKNLLMTDRVQILCAVATRLDQITQEMSNVTPAKQAKLMFDYIEQAQIYLENIQYPENCYEA